MTVFGFFWSPPCRLAQPQENMSIAVKTLRNIQRTVAANEPFLETAIRWRRNACEFKGTKVHQVGEDKYGNKCVTLLLSFVANQPDILKTKLMRTLIT